jgi:hypothetical protein
LPRLLILHLLPGALLTLVYAVGGRLWAGRDGPPLLILMLCVGVVEVPFELGVLLRAPKRATGSISLLANGTVNLRYAVDWWGPTPAWQLGGLLAGTFAWAAVVFTVLVGALDGVLLPLFQWVPSWFFLSTEYGRYSRSVLLLTAALFVLLSGVVGPVVELTSLMRGCMSFPPCGVVPEPPAWVSQSSPEVPMLEVYRRSRPRSARAWKEVLQWPLGLTEKGRAALAGGFPLCCVQPVG